MLNEMQNLERIDLEDENWRIKTSVESFESEYNICTAQKKFHSPQRAEKKSWLQPDWQWHKQDEEKFKGREFISNLMSNKDQRSKMNKTLVPSSIWAWPGIYSPGTGLALIMYAGSQADPQAPSRNEKPGWSDEVETAHQITVLPQQQSTKPL